MITRLAGLALGAMLAGTGTAAAPGTEAAALPAGVKAVWDPGAAWRETTPTRERISLNGLWRWQPGTNDAAAVPVGDWGWFKVPGCWPGTRDYMQQESQTLFPHPAWKDAKIERLSAAWYQREFSVPPAWKGRRVSLGLDTLNSFAVVYVDGAKAGEITFPGGNLDLTAACAPGTTHALSLLVIGMPLKAVMMSYADSAHAKAVKGEVERRGLCGDVFLVGEPAGPRVADVAIRPSVRRWEIGFDAGLAGLDPQASYRLTAKVSAEGRPLRTFTSGPFSVADVKGGRWSFIAPWHPDRLWDTDTPGHQMVAAVTLESARGKRLDEAFPATFGFRELWIEGRNLILNGTPVHVSAEPEDNTAISALAAGYAASRETFARMKASGFNAVYSHNYGTDPGTHLAYAEFLRAADDAGMLVFFALPHFGNYDWKGPDADATNGYARHCAAYVRIAQNHPAVVMYAMSHNGAGYEEDMNPDLMGNGNPPRNQWSARGAREALRAEAIAHALDPTRVVYHHSAGDLGQMDTINFYGNQLPAQEMAEWMEPWAARGGKPVFLCEFGSPLSWDWAMYRGWFEGQREWGSAAVPWEFCPAEWNAQALGDRAYDLEDIEKIDLRWEAEQFRKGEKGWHRWDYGDYHGEIGSHKFTHWNPIFADVLTQQLRGLRTSGLSGYCLWDESMYWNPREGVRRDRRALPVDWDHLQRPGYSADFADANNFESWRVSYEAADWKPTVAGEAIIRNSRPLLAWIAGSATGFTSREHDYLAGETVAKQLIVVNDTRRPVTCAGSWSCALPSPVGGTVRVTVEPGGQARLPIALPLPGGLAAGRYALSATVAFSTGETQTDAFTLDVLPPPNVPAPAGRIAVFDPAGETTRMLEARGLHAEPVGVGGGLHGVSLLVVGRGALSATGPAPDLSAVRDGLKVIVFEQTAAALERRLGFRVAEYGLRQVFRRVPDHPALAGLTEDVLHDWRGSATLVPPRLAYELVEEHGPTISWCGIPVSRVWRCGTRGNVATVVIEKPPRGDFFPILDGGFDLQYSPLLEYREGKGVVVFCQMDVTGRTDADPAADRLVGNLLAYAAGWKPAPRRTVSYAGEAAGRTWLESAGFKVRSFTGGPVRADELVVLGPGATAKLPGRWAAGGGRAIAIGLDGRRVRTLTAIDVSTTPTEHIAAVFAPSPPGSPLAGVGAAEAHVRAPRVLPLVAGGAVSPVGDGVLAASRDGALVVDQLAPWTFQDDKGWTAIREDPTADRAKNPEAFVKGGLGLRRTFRRTSFLLARLLANQGAAGSTPLLERFWTPVQPKEERYLTGLYLDRPIEWDDPYRFFRW